MTTRETEANEEAHASDQTSPGQLIALARKANALSQSDLAARMRLDTKMIQALERDDYENLPAPMFVKGYIRSIAKELHVDAEAVLDAYASHASLEPPGLADFSSRPPEQVSTNSALIKTITYALIAALLLLMAIWWQSNYRKDNNVEEATATREIPGDSAEPLSYEFEQIDHGEPEWRLDRPTPDLPREIRPGSSSKKSAATLIELPTAALSETPSEQAIVNSGSEDDDAVETSDNNDAEAVDTRGSHTLTVATSNEAWVEIYDAAGEQLYFGMARAGKDVTVKARNFYRITLGNTGSITLSFDGEVIDLAPHSDQGVAKLELGDAPNNEGETP